MLLVDAQHRAEEIHQRYPDCDVSVWGDLTENGWLVLCTYRPSVRMVTFGRSAELDADGYRILDTLIASERANRPTDPAEQLPARKEVP